MTFWDGTPGSNNLFWHTMTEYPDMYHLMQFTGLKDRSGKEIYEGDLVIPVNINDNRLFEIKWREDVYAICGDNGDEFLMIEEFEGCEAVGNIYEHPYLLNKPDYDIPNDWEPNYNGETAEERLHQII